MLNLAYHYGILYQEQHGDMLFFSGRSLPTKELHDFLATCSVRFFKRSMQTEPMPISLNLSHAFRSASTMSYLPF